MVAGGILVLLSPLGPIVVLTEVIPPLWEKITWLWNNWNSEDILVRAQEVLREDILPGIIGAVSGVAGALAGASAWLAGLVTRLSTALTGVLGAFGGIRCLAAVTTYLEGASAQFERLAAWANSEFEGLGPALQAVLEALVAILRPILDFLVRLAMVASVPACCRSSSRPRSGGCVPTGQAAGHHFVLDLLIAFVEAMPELLSRSVRCRDRQGRRLGFLRHLRERTRGYDETRIAVSNKVASLAGGGGLEFMAGFAFGLLHGRARRHHRPVQADLPAPPRDGARGRAQSGGRSRRSFARRCRGSLRPWPQPPPTDDRDHPTPEAPAGRPRPAGPGRSCRAALERARPTPRWRPPLRGHGRGAAGPPAPSPTSTRRPRG